MAIKRGNRGGFSLVEVLIAVLIMAVGITGLVEGLSTTLYSSRDSEKLTTAAYLAAGQIEFIRSDGILLEGTNEGQWTGQLEGYSYTEEIRESDTEGLYEITVVILESSTSKKIYELKTYLFEAPLQTTSLLSEEDEKENIRDEQKSGRGGVR